MNILKFLSLAFVVGAVAIEAGALPYAAPGQLASRYSGISYEDIPRYLAGKRLEGLVGVNFGEDASKNPQKFKLLNAEAVLGDNHDRTLIHMVQNGNLQSAHKSFKCEKYSFRPLHPLLNASRYECYASSKTHKVFRIVVRFPGDKSKTSQEESLYVMELFRAKYQKVPMRGRSGMGVGLLLKNGKVDFTPIGFGWRFLFGRPGEIESGVWISVAGDMLRESAFASCSGEIKAVNFNIELEASREGDARPEKPKVKRSDLDAL